MQNLDFFSPFNPFFQHLNWIKDINKYSENPIVNMGKLKIYMCEIVNKIYAKSSKFCLYIFYSVENLKQNSFYSDKSIFLTYQLFYFQNICPCPWFYNPWTCRTRLLPHWHTPRLTTHRWSTHQTTHHQLRAPSHPIQYSDHREN